MTPPPRPLEAQRAQADVGRHGTWCVAIPATSSIASGITRAVRRRRGRCRAGGHRRRSRTACPRRGLLDRRHRPVHQVRLRERVSTTPPGSRVDPFFQPGGHMRQAGQSSATNMNTVRRTTRSPRSSVLAHSAAPTAGILCSGDDVGATATTTGASAVPHRDRSTTSTCSPLRRRARPDVPVVRRRSRPAGRGTRARQRDQLL